MNKDLAEFIQLVLDIESRISEETNIVYTRFKSVPELKQFLENEIRELREGNIDKLDSLHSLFGPTATFQEISIANGWGNEFLGLAERADKLISIIFSDRDKPSF